MDANSTQQEDNNIIARAVGLISPLSDNPGTAVGVAIKFEASNRSQARAVAAAITYANWENEAESGATVGKTLDLLMKNQNQFTYDDKEHTATIKLLPPSHTSWTEFIGDLTDRMSAFQRTYYLNEGEKDILNDVKTNEGVIRIVPAYPEMAKRISPLQGQLLSIIAKAHNIDLNYEVLKKPLVETREKYIRMSSSDREVATSHYLAALEAANAKHQQIVEDKLALERQLSEQAAKTAAELKEKAGLAAQNPRAVDIDHLQGLINYTPSLDKKASVALLQTAIAQLATSLDVRDDATLEKAKATEETKTRVAMHRELAAMLLSKATVKRAANAIGIPKAMGEQTSMDETVYQKGTANNANYFSLPEVQEFLIEQASSNPGMLLLMQASVLRTIDGCKNSANEFLHGKRGAHLAPDEKRDGLLTGTPPYTDEACLEFVVNPAVKDFFNAHCVGKTKG